MATRKKEIGTRGQIIIATIGAVAVLGAALLGNWDKFSGSTATKDEKLEYTGTFELVRPLDTAKFTAEFDLKVRGQQVTGHFDTTMDGAGGTLIGNLEGKRLQLNLVSASPIMAPCTVQAELSRDRMTLGGIFKCSDDRHGMVDLVRKR